MSSEDKIQMIIGLTEKVTIKVAGKSKTYDARIDTGAMRSSIDKDIVKEFNLGPVLKEVMIKNAQGVVTRPVVKVNIEMAKQKLKGDFSVANREHMKFPILIGRDILSKGFLIDATKNVSKISGDEKK